MLLARSALLLAAGVAAVLAAVPAAAETYRRAVPVWVTGVGPGGRTLALAFQIGGCQRAPRASVRETPTTVTIHLTVVDERGTTVACPAVIGVGRRTVRLARPLDGRRIRGWSAPQMRAAPGRCGLRMRRVPSTVGMAAADARRLLRQAELTGQGASAGLVRAQSPRPYRCVSPRSGVRLTLAR